MKCNMNHRDSYKWPDPPSEREDYKYYPQKHCPKTQTETILRCGNSVGSIPLGTNSVAGARLSNGLALDSCSVIVASVSLDLSELIDPTIKLDFSSLISFRTTNNEYFSLRLQFNLSKYCDGGKIPLGTWTFERIQNETSPDVQEGDFIQETDPFSFTWCECEACPDCCRYVLEVEEYAYNIDFATLSNISLSALAVGIKQAY